MPTPTSPFDRLANTRRNKKLRNLSLAAALISLLLFALIFLERFFNDEALGVPINYILGGLTILFFCLTIQFHLRFKTRE